MLGVSPGGNTQSRPNRGRRPQSRIKAKHVKDPTLQVPSGDQVPSPIGQVADGQPAYGTDAPRQTTDAVPGEPHVSARRLLLNSPDQSATRGRITTRTQPMPLLRKPEEGCQVLGKRPPQRDSRSAHFWGVG
jgi:hypothetical protein